MSWKPAVPWPYPLALPQPQRPLLASKFFVSAWISLAILWGLTFLFAAVGVPGAFLTLIAMGFLVPVTVILLVAFVWDLARRSTGPREMDGNRNR